MADKEQMVLEAMKKVGKPVRPGDVAKMIGLDSKEVSKMRKIYLIPVRKIERDLLAYLSSQLGKIFPFSVKIGKALADPDYAYNESRGQYQSDLILRRLQKLDLQGVEKILGVVDVDLYTPGLNFVFGQASIGGGAALIALPRLRQEFYRLPQDEKLYHSRTIKEAVHELGHTFGLGHCENARCVMHFSNSLADTDYKGKEFCKNCLNLLRSFCCSCFRKRGNYPKDYLA